MRNILSWEGDSECKIPSRGTLRSAGDLWSRELCEISSPLQRLFSVPVCTGRLMPVYIAVLVRMYACKWRPEVDIRCLPQMFTASFFMTGSLPEPVADLATTFGQ